MRLFWQFRVFGSVARGHDGPDSDVDLLVDLPEQTGVFTVLALEGTLERIRDVKVDLAPVGSLKPRVRDEARADAIALLCRSGGERSAHP